VPTIAANGIDLYYERLGSGPPLLFVNGSGATIDSSRPLIEVFARSFDVAVHDQRGLGKTSVPPDPYTMADYAADAAALADHLGWDTFSLFGVSFGGMVAQELAVTVPERIERLVLACTSPGGEGGSSYPLHELEALPPDERAARGLAILDSRFTPEWLAEHPADRGLVEMQVARRGEPKADEQLRGERAQLEARSHHDVCDRLGRITCPTLVASGRYDGIAPVPNGEFIARRIGASAQLRVYEGGHLFFVQDPAALPDLTAFLAGDPLGS
jgi:pimeloyl-ACP methyl ester carboxylesterase